MVDEPELLPADVLHVMMTTVITISTAIKITHPNTLLALSGVFFLSVDWFVSLSSGKKRRDLDIYENKEFKSRNGYEVVNWCLECLKEFPYKGRIIVKWADVRRRKIYGRFLVPLGFRLVRFEQELYYFKKYE